VSVARERAGNEEVGEMTAKSSKRTREPRRTVTRSPAHPPFTRIYPPQPAAIEEFEREHMGIAAKE